MDGKVPCIACGARILKATAERNGGKCAPCKSGTRASIEESKRRIEQERNRLPEPNYWLPLVDKESMEGFDALSSAERIYFCACLLDGEVYNGGFEQYFTNSSGDHYYETQASLSALDLSECLDLLRQAKLIVFGRENVPVDRQARTQAASATLQVAANCRRLDEIDTRFVEAFKRTGDRVEEFAVKNNLRFVLK
jgi:Domain of unknown function (DUF4375)